MISSLVSLVHKVHCIHQAATVVVTTSTGSAAIAAKRFLPIVSNKKRRAYYFNNLQYQQRLRQSEERLLKAHSELNAAHFMAFGPLWFQNSGSVLRNFVGAMGKKWVVSVWGSLSGNCEVLLSG